MPISDEIIPVMWERHGEPWQRWRIEDAADETGYLIQSMHNRQYLTANGDAANGRNPWFEGRHGFLKQQWIVTIPHGHNPH